MVKLQFPQVETDKEVQAPILKTRTIPRVLPVTIRDARRQHEDDKAMSMMSFLATCLLFTGFLMVLFSVKTVWDLKIENWRLVKENAALKKTVRDNVSAEKFRQQITSEDEILEFEHPANFEDPDLSWSVSIQIFWSSPFITPCNMNWLARELADQIYERKKELDQENKNDKTFFEDFEKKSIETEDEIMHVPDEPYEVATGGPYKKSTEDLELNSKEDILKTQPSEVPYLTSNLFLDDGSQIVLEDKTYDDETKKELEQIFNEVGYDLELELQLETENKNK